VDDLWATRSEDVGLIVRAISFQDFQPMWSWSTNATDGQTDGQTDDMWFQYRALHYSASRGKNKPQKWQNWTDVTFPESYLNNLFSKKNLTELSRNSTVRGLETKVWFLPRDALQCKARSCYCMSSVRPSVRLSVCDVGAWIMTT